MYCALAVAASATSAKQLERGGKGRHGPTGTGSSKAFPSGNPASERVSEDRHPGVRAGVAHG